MRKLSGPGCVAVAVLCAACSDATTRPPGLTSGTTPRDTTPVTTPQPKPTATWLKSVGIPLQRTDPAGPVDDLRPFAQMIGNAHVIGLGEGTHGTREFFRMKHRILELLVTEMGFTRFAIEASTV